MQTTILTTCDNIQEAYFLESQLKSAGIECFLSNENATNLMPHRNRMMGSGIQIFIDENDLEIASKIIEETQVDSDKILCPNCKSDNVVLGHGQFKPSIMKIISLALLASVPFLKNKNSYFCQNCRFQFKA